MDRLCEFCGAVLEETTRAGDMVSAERRFVCHDCGIAYWEDPAGTLYETE